MRKAWTLAFERFAKAITAGAGDGKRTWRALTDQWLATANDTLIEVQRSDDFLQAQRRMLRAASDRRLQERRVAEAWCEATHVPTRTEVDELQRQVVELRRELRLLKRALQTSPNDTPTNTDARTARASARRVRPGAKRSPRLKESEMPSNRKSAAVQAIAELDDLNFKLARGQRMPAAPEGRRGEDRHRRQGGGVSRGQDDALPVQADGPSAHDRRAGPGRVRADRPLHDDRPAGRPLAPAQPARARRRRLRVDWGSPTRGDRWLTFEDYVDVYLADCVEHICRAHDVPAINLLGICEGGVFSLCYAALYPARVKNLILTITPVDFHQDQAEGRPGHGFINLWTRSLTDEDIEQLIEANGNLPGELMSHVFSQMTPGATMSKYNVGLLDTFDDEKKLLNFLRMEKWLADRPHHPVRPPSSC
jgi:polyhydroxyalkanoate synthase